MLRKKHSQHAEQDFELNITSIIDCFTVLIAYLLVASSFISIGIFDVGIAVKSTVPTIVENLNDIPLSISILVQGPEEAIVKLSGKEQRNIPVKTPAELENLLNQLVSTHTNIVDATVGGFANLQFQELMHFVEAAKKAIPKVYIGDDEI